uniref:Uncharacterized protein n=1 Tax=Arundo donax TaxID=35708 RepID=A0A0A8ZT71_ARUDO
MLLETTRFLVQVNLEKSRCVILVNELKVINFLILSLIVCPMLL